MPNLFHKTHSQQSKWVFRLETYRSASKISVTCTAYPQSILCKYLSWEPKATFAILLLVKKEKRKPLPTASLLNNLLPQVTMDRRVNPKWRMCWQSSQFPRSLIDKHNQLHLLAMQHMGLSQAVGFCCIYFPTASYPPERGASGPAGWNKGVLSSCPWKEQESHATEEKQRAALIRHEGS